MKNVLLSLSVVALLAASGSAFAVSSPNKDADAHAKRQQAASEAKRQQNNSQVNKVIQQKRYEATRPTSSSRPYQAPPSSLKRK
jgi:hypothetical protein